MTNHSTLFDDWIRDDFIDLNTELENLYWQQSDRANVESIGQSLKQALEQQGQHFINALLAEGNTNQGFDHAFDLLGNVGLYMAACRRHEITEPSRETHSPLIEASTLAMHIGASIGVTPRFATAHLTTHNKAVEGEYKRFTHLPDERVFIDFNTKGILAYKQAADALIRIQPLGISHPATADLLTTAIAAIQTVQKHNQTLFHTLDAERFFYCVRPYYKPYRVGSVVYRGANAGDFAGINVIDLLTGLCAGNDKAYSQMLVDKFLYMMPEDQAILRDCMRRPSMLDLFLQQQHCAHHSWFQENLHLFLQLCQVHGQAATQHHDQLVEKFINQPSQSLQAQHLDKLTASGPALPILIDALEKLRDRRTAAPRSDIKTRYHDIKTLSALIGQHHGL